MRNVPLEVLGILTLAVVCFGDELPPLKWVKTIGEFTGMPGDIIEISDSSFLYSEALINKRDGSVIKKISGFTLQNSSRTHQNGFVVADENRIILLNNDFEPQWSKEIDTTRLEKVLQTRDGGYAALGRTGLSTQRIFRTDSNGTVLWTATIDTNAYYDSDTVAKLDIKGIAYVADGLIVYGECMKMFTLWMDSWLIKYSTDGAEVWRKMFGGTRICGMVSSEDGVVFSGNVNHNGWVIIDQGAGQSTLGKRSYFPSTQVPIIHVGADGTILFNKEFSSSGYDYAQSIIKYGSTYYLSYFSNFLPPGLNHSLAESIVAVNKTGDTVWSKVYDSITPPANRVCDLQVQPLSSGGMVIAAFDSLYYYENPAEVHHSPGLNETTNKQTNGVLSYFRSGDIIYILRKPSKTTVSLFAINGKLVKTFDEGFKAAGRYRITTGTLSKGTYLVCFKDGDRFIGQSTIVSK